jgi:hypothetical protein
MPPRRKRKTKLERGARLTSSQWGLIGQRDFDFDFATSLLLFLSRERVVSRQGLRQNHASHFTSLGAEQRSSRDAGRNAEV